MTTRKQILYLFLLLFLACSCGSVNQKSDKIQNPNIIYILADDLGYGDLSFLGQTKFETPNIDRLAKSGMVFTQHYAGSTVCAPSRSALLTGQHTGHTPVRGNKAVQPEGQYPIPSETYTLGEMLQKSGYATGCFGKWGLGYPGSEGDPNNQGFDEFYGYNCQRLAHHYYPWHLWDNQKKVILTENEGQMQNAYAPHLIHDKALNFIEQYQDQPFFMFYASLIPHAELVLPEGNLEQFRGKLLPEKSYKGVDGGKRYRQGPYGSQSNTHAAFAAMVTLLDKQVGEIMDKLDALGIADNTLVIFTSDNGPHREGGADPEFFNSNGKFRGFKRDLYEGGIRVPMIARWTGKIQAGETTDHISAFWDIMPTIADITDAEIKDNIDGISFWPTLSQQGSQKQHEYLYWEFHEKGGRVAVRKGKWKGVKYNVLKQPGKPIELYNLDLDPGENNDLAETNPEKAAELTRIMMEARTDSEVFQFAAPTYLQVD